MDQRLTTALQEVMADQLEKYIAETPIRLHVDGLDISLESHEVERDGGEINIKIDLGLRDIILRHPDEYNENLHWSFFSDEERERIEFQQRMMEVA
jgi:hypothetical protein